MRPVGEERETDEWCEGDRGTCCDRQSAFAERKLNDGITQTD